MTDPLTYRDWLLVSEQFYTHQGEGPTAGQLAYFVRLGGCNLNCWWCDTPYTWVFDERHVAMHRSGKQFSPQHELKRTPIYRLADSVVDSPARRLIVTGGEPMLQQEGILRLFERVVWRDPNRNLFEIETAGTIAPHENFAFFNVQWNVSLKLAHSRNELEKRRVPEAISDLRSRNSVFKFVVNPSNPEPDIDEICQLIDEFEIPGERVWLMPQGTRADEITQGLRKVNDYALSYGWNISSRTHVYIYGDERGH